MAGGVVGAAVGLNLDDAYRPVTMNHQFAEQVGSDEHGVSGEERPLKRSSHKPGPHVVVPLPTGGRWAGSRWSPDQLIHPGPIGGQPGHSPLTLLGDRNWSGASASDSLGHGTTRGQKRQRR